MLSKKTMMGVSKGTRSSDSQRKVFVRSVREIDVTVNWSISMLVVREGCYLSLGKVASGKRRSWKDRFLLSSRSWDTDYSSFWRTLYICNLIVVTGPRPAKHILWRCVDIWQSSYPKNKVCVWRATGQKPLKRLPSCPISSISFKESYRITSCLC